MAATVSSAHTGALEPRAAKAGIAWYRTPLPREELRALNQRSDFKGLLQTVGFLGWLTFTAALACYSARHFPWPVTVALTFGHGMGWAFLVNGFHELIHNSVFQTRWLNVFFLRIIAFLGWLNPHMFWASHTEHHKFTLHPPDDLEVVLPMQVTLRSFLQHGIVSPWALWGTLRGTFRLACGIVEGEWANILFPADEPEKRRDLINWARLLLIGHGALVIVSLALGWWMVPVVVTLAPFYGGWFQPLLNHAQHVGLQDNVPDFRLCCRTITLNPFVQFLYWHMNFHTEHHMFAAVPCYNLPRLHRLIKSDLPPCPHGVIATWREILPILRRQKIEPGYQYVAPLPPARTTTTTGHSTAAGAGAANGAAASYAG